MKTVGRDRIKTLRYRLHFLAVDQRQIRIVVAASSIALSLTTRNDFLLVSKSTLGPLLAVRAAYILMAIGIYVLLGKRQSLRRVEQLASSWNILTAFLLILIGFSRVGTGEIQAPFLGTIAFICVFYFAQRGFLFTRLISCLIITALFVERLANGPLVGSTSARTTGIVFLLLVNILGIAMTRSLEHQRCARHEAEREEKRIRLQLVAKNRALEIQKSRAEALYRSRTTFLAAMSHEFRTPMNAVIGLSDILVNAPLAPEHRDHARVIRESASSLLVLLNDVLDFAKIDAGKLELAATPFHLRSLVNSVAEMMKPAALAKNIALNAQFAPHLPEYVLGDDARLRQVLVNLLSNAIKFTNQGSVTFIIDAKKQPEPFFEIEFSVRDTGIGMSPEILERLFQPFEQGDGGIGRRFGGTGLGLVISQKIVQALDSEIRVESEEGKGSTFSFVLEMAESKAPVRHTPFPAKTPQPNRGAISILVVDDLHINRMVAKLMLERLGYSADFAEDGLAAIEAISTKKYDVVLMDLQMPGMSGIETTKAIVEKLDPKQLPAIIAMSASVFEEDRLACQNVGMCDFIAKPIDIARLDDTLARWTGSTNPAREEISAPPGFDASALDRLRELEGADNPDFVAELCRDFVADVPGRVMSMKAALEKQEWVTLKREAHSLKSNAASLGAAEMAKICAAIELAAHSNQAKNATTGIEQLEREFPNVQQALAVQGYV